MMFIVIELLFKNRNDKVSSIQYKTQYHRKSLMTIEDFPFFILGYNKLC